MGTYIFTKSTNIRDVMSTLVVLLLSFVSFSGSAGLRTSAHWPVSGDKVTKTHYEYLDMPKDSVIWDFSRAIETDGSHDMVWLNLGDSVIVRIESGSQSVLICRNDSLLFDKYESPLLGLRSPSPPLLLSGGFPPVGDSITSPCRFRGRFSGYNSVEFSGVITTKTLSSGTLILPNDTLNDVTRIRQTIDGTLLASPDTGNIGDGGREPSLRLTVVTDRWYSEFYRYELVENLSMRYRYGGELVKEFEVTGICSPDEQDYAVARAPENHSLPPEGHGAYNSDTVRLPMIRSAEITNNGGNIDVAIDLSNSTSNNTSVVVTLSDQLGRIWSSREAVLSTGSVWHASIPAASLPSGYYILYITTGTDFRTYKFRLSP